ncbi:MAG TPA: DUF3106 domain-containing protein [Arenimonas sp.]|uniref:DUF3106 domain-containing protein n=1 Tax=Arenimonas sp. TaxID=1872635 RepID=UPI002CD7779B|nr:DUF3106 domain-containing protein [Arenimonas sp.]HMB55727.1 DUF3106 domain-containing protein [Arenimonas sp.]
MNTHRAGLILLLLAACGSVQAQRQVPRPANAVRESRLAENARVENVRAPAWKELNPQQQTDLGSFAARWDRMPEARRAQILQRYERWKALPPEKRAALRQGAQNFQQMSPDQRQKLRSSLQAMRTMPPEQQRELRQQWQALTPEQRREWLDAGGPGVAPAPKP